MIGNGKEIERVVARDCPPAISHRLTLGEAIGIVRQGLDRECACRIERIAGVQVEVAEQHLAIAGIDDKIVLRLFRNCAGKARRSVSAFGG